ncbi:MAG TPA: DUF1552 domain-containing protein [Polyangiaceae bacterium]|nr:DUF1552 domain-containing protein [Polyangiaceae bacterium]
MAKFRLNRRSVLRGAGSIAIALPWLEAMEPARAQAAATTAQRFLAVYTPGGTVLEKWRPTGTETAPVLGTILKPLEPVLPKLLIMDGLEMMCAKGEQHQAGIIGWLTGTPQEESTTNYSTGPSLDQAIATLIAGTRAKRSIEIAVRWATGKSHGLVSPINAANFEDNDQHSPIPPRIDPQQIWQDLFGSIAAEPGSDEAARLARKKSILDFVDRRYVNLSARLGAADKQKIDQHLTKIREIEQGLQALPPMSATCMPPMLIDTSDYDPASGLNSADDGSIMDNSTDTAIPKVGKLMMDMMVMALACDITAVGSLQWSDTEAKHTFPWLGLPDHHHFYQHDGGFRAPECEQIGIWYSEMHLHLLQAMDAIDMGGHTLLDESVVFFGSELQEPPSHAKTDMPFLLAGGGGGLKGGRWLQNGGKSHNDLLTAIINLYGANQTTFGDPNYCAAPLTNLT